ncbi:MAG: serine hydrolase [Saprospiraceae bacterium]|nr:serine hydrolase [Saprospiraceae bacterium]
MPKVVGRIASIVLLFCVTSIGYSQSQSELIEKLDSYIEQARQQWEVPGLSVAIVKDGEVLLTKGYGVRSLTTPAKVDQNTIFSIGSTTKAMVSAAMGMLVDEGLVSWEDKVMEYLPDFQLYDAYASRELRVRDLFTHNAGLGNADLLWYYNDLGSDEILERIRRLKPAYPFRGGYTYQNIMYLAAGKLIAKVSGKPWPEFMQERIFSPLGMNNTYPTLQASQQQKNRSIPHHHINDQVTPIEDCSADPIAPAGAIWSSVSDMAKWMQFLLDTGKVNGRALLELETYQELFKPQVIIPREQFYPTTALTNPTWTTYGLGWFQHDYQGYALQFHTGSLPGTVAIIGLVPELDLGVYMLGNLDHAEVRHALLYQVIDAFRGEMTQDWSTEFKRLYKQIATRQTLQRKELMLSRQSETRTSKRIADYVGIYYDPFWGKVEIQESDDKLQLKVSSQLGAELEHWHYDTFNAEWSRKWMGDTLISFELAELNGEVETLKIGNRQYKRISD